MLLLCCFWKIKQTYQAEKYIFIPKMATLQQKRYQN